MQIIVFLSSIIRIKGREHDLVVLSFNSYSLLKEDCHEKIKGS